MNSSSWKANLYLSDTLMKTLFASIIMLLFSATGIQVTVLAQCKKVNGQVLDQQTGEVLPGATVRFYANAVVKTNNTDSFGKFELASMEVDSLIVSFIGYEDRLIRVTGSCEFVIELTSSEMDLNETLIQAERLIAEEFVLKKITKLEIYTNPSAKADPLLAVNSMPSATTIDESATISLRGSSPTETGVFLNNVPINDAVRYAQLNGIGTFSIFNTALISQVQVYPGNPPLEFGSTTSGLIALTTDENIPNKNSNTVSVSLANIGFHTQRKLSKSSSLTIYSNYQPSTPIRWVNQAALDRVKQFTALDFGLHYFVKINDRTTAKVFSYSNRESFQYLNYGPTYTGIFNQEKARNHTVTNLRHRLKKGELSWNSGFSFSKTNFSLSTIKIDQKLNDYFTSLNYQYFGKNYELKVGFSYDYRGSGSEGTYPRYPFALGEQYPSDTIVQRLSTKVPEGYIYAKYYLSSKWIAGGGIRKNISTANQEDYLSSQFNISFRPSATWSFIGSAGRYNKHILLQRELSVPVHIQSDQYSVDMNYTKPGIDTSLSLFYKRGRHLGKKSNITGIELYGRYRFDEHWRAQLSLTSLNAKETVNGHTRSSRYDIHYFFRGNIEYKFAGTWTASTAFLFRQGSFYTPVLSASLHSVTGTYKPMYGDIERLPGYKLIDLSFSKLMNWGENVNAIAFCGISNVPNFKNVRDYYYNEDYTVKSENLFSLRTLYFGCMINF